MLGKRLKEERGKRTQEEISKQLGISRARYSHYENDHVQPDNELLQKMADLYNTSVDYLLGRTDNKERSEEKKEINHEAVTDLIEFLTSPNSTINGNPIPQDFINDIVGYVRTRTAMDKPKDKP